MYVKIVRISRKKNNARIFPLKLYNYQLKLNRDDCKIDCSRGEADSGIENGWGGGGKGGESGFKDRIKPI